MCRARADIGVNWDPHSQKTCSKKALNALRCARYSGIDNESNGSAGARHALQRAPIDGGDGSAAADNHQV
jgi:hypothetical protein